MNALAPDAPARAATLDDLPALVDLLRALELGIISRLAPPVLDAYFRAAIEHGKFLVRIIEDDAGLLGFSVVNTDLCVARAAPFYSRPLRVLVLMLVHPVSAWIMLHYVISRWFQSAESDRASRQFQWELYYIGVHARARRQGIGSRLLGDIGIQMRAAGATYLGLEVFTAEHGAVAFYQELNAEPLGEVRTGSTISKIMRLHENDLPS